MDSSAETVGRDSSQLNGSVLGDIDWSFIGTKGSWVGIELPIGIGRAGGPFESFPDSLKIHPAQGMLKWEFRTLFYAGPLALRGFYDFYTRHHSHDHPLGNDLEVVDRSHSLQLLVGLHKAFWRRRIHVEPLIGYGWMNDWAWAFVHAGPTAYYTEKRGGGLVLGLEQSLRVLPEGLYLRGIYRQGESPLRNQRLKVEVLAIGRPPEDRAHTEPLYPGVAMFLSLGYHGVWKSDRRREDAVYLNLGLFAVFSGRR